jgi:predicted O-methyltransferase YrrM
MSDREHPENVKSHEHDLPTEHLYDQSPRLTPEYISEILNIKDDRVDFLGTITGGVDRAEARLIARTVSELDPTLSLEVGLGYGFSAITICASGRRPRTERRHIVIDPHQASHWRNGGLKHIEEAGFTDMIELRADYSYRALPRLEQEGLSVDFAFIDGWHTFDFVFVDFFFIDKMLREGGVVMFDDADWPSIRPVLRYIVSNLPYSVVATLPETRPREAIDIELGLEGSCIGLRKEKTLAPREVFFHRPF